MPAINPIPFEELHPTSKKAIRNCFEGVQNMDNLQLNATIQKLEKELQECQRTHDDHPVTSETSMEAVAKYSITRIYLQFCTTERNNRNTLKPTNKHNMVTSKRRSMG